MLVDFGVYGRMELSENQLNLAAILFEIGVPVAAIVVAVRVSRLRKFTVVILGAIAPPLLFYLAVAVAYYLNPSDKGNIFAFYAMWIMSFFVYATLFLGGLILAFIPRPSNLYGRFFLGMICAPISYLVLNALLDRLMF